VQCFAAVLGCCCQQPGCLLKLLLCCAQYADFQTLLGGASYVHQKLA
jgi:hypothetical protein